MNILENSFWTNLDIYKFVDLEWQFFAIVLRTRFNVFRRSFRVTQMTKLKWRNSEKTGYIVRVTFSVLNILQQKKVETRKHPLEYRNQRSQSNDWRAVSGFFNAIFNHQLKCVIAFLHNSQITETIYFSISKSFTDKILVFFRVFLLKTSHNCFWNVYHQVVDFALTRERFICLLHTTLSLSCHLPMQKLEL